MAKLDGERMFAYRGYRVVMTVRAGSASPYSAILVAPGGEQSPMGQHFALEESAREAARGDVDVLVGPEPAGVMESDHE